MENIEYRIRITKRQEELLREIDRDALQPMPDYLEGVSERFVTNLHRRLYGIIGIDEGWSTYAGEESPRDERKCFSFYIPHENEDAVSEARETGWFRKSLKEEDLGVLDTIYDRMAWLHDSYGRGWYPRFYVREVARRTKLNEREARRSLDRLIGVLGIAYTKIVPRSSWRSHKKYSSDYNITTAPAWFIPEYRLPLIKELLHGPEEDPNQAWLFPEVRKRRRKNFRIERRNGSE
ncbi:MAG: hypothetical protein KKA90_04655 [Nanoarchaeota archaeon]|nr:hypothetical protein [Nanoarchaeota archaeon]